MAGMIAASTAFTAFADNIMLYDLSSQDVRAITGHKLEATSNTKVYRGDSVDDWLDCWDLASLIVEYDTVSGTQQRDVPITREMVKGFSSSDLGNKAVTMEYGGLTYKTSNGNGIAYEVVEKADSLATNRIKTEYIVGDVYNRDDWVVTATFPDLKTEIGRVPLKKLKGFNTSTVGTKDIAFRAFGVDERIRINVKQDDGTIASLKVNNPKTTYIIGEDFSDEGTVTVTYDDSTSRDIFLTKNLISGFSTQQEGTFTATVNYKGQTTPISYTVVKDPDVVDIIKPVKTISLNNDVTTQYKVGDRFDSNGSVLVTYTDDTTDTVRLIASMLTGFDTASEGQKVITVTYGGKSAVYNINVSKDSATPSKEIQSIKVNSDVTTSYNRYDKFDGKGTVAVTYVDGTTNQVNITGGMITVWPTNTVGEVMVRLIYEGKETEYKITVTESSSFVDIATIFVNADVTKNYKKDDAFDGKGSITVSYKNGIQSTVPLLSSYISGWDTSIVGSKTITISYMGVNATYSIQVTELGIVPEDKTVQRIQVGNDVTKKYVKDAKFDGKGTIIVTYTDATMQTLPLVESMLFGFTTAKYGSYVVKVTYGGKSAQYTIFVDRAISDGSGSGGSSGSGSSSSGDNSTTGFTKRPTHYGDNSKDYSDSKVSGGTSSFSSSSSPNTGQNNTSSSNFNKANGFNSKGKPVGVPNNIGEWQKITISKGGVQQSAWKCTLKGSNKTAEKQWVGNGTDWYYLGDDGVMLTGWQYINGEYYWLNPKEANQGACEYGWKLTSTDKKWYFCSPVDGHLCQGWTMVDGKWYYFTKAGESKANRPTGSMWANETTPDGYKVDVNGAWIK